MTRSIEIETKKSHRMEILMKSTKNAQTAQDEMPVQTVPHRQPSFGRSNEKKRPAPREQRSGIVIVYDLSF